MSVEAKIESAESCNQEPSKKRIAKRKALVLDNIIRRQEFAIRQNLNSGHNGKKELGMRLKLSTRDSAGQK